MPDSLLAHREERRLLGINFALDLPSGVTITGVDEFIVYDSANPPVDVTDEFTGGTPSFSISGLVVSFWKEIAAAGEQLPGRYRVRLRPTVDNAEKPIALDPDGKLIHLRIVGD